MLYYNSFLPNISIPMDQPLGPGEEQVMDNEIC
jgi:hypothetical protein